VVVQSSEDKQVTFRGEAEHVAVAQGVVDVEGGTAFQGAAGGGEDHTGTSNAARTIQLPRR